MNKSDVRLAKNNILKCFTEDFDYKGQLPNTKSNRKRKLVNQALFDKKEGYACWTGTNLELVMDKVVLGLYLALADSENEE